METSDGGRRTSQADEGQRWAEKEISSETTVVSEVVKLKDGGPRLGTPGAATHTGARRGVPLLGRFLRPGHWLSLTRGPGALAGGPEGARERDARTAHVVPLSMA
jgi:hypothetical protein